MSFKISWKTYLWFNVIVAVIAILMYDSIKVMSMYAVVDIFYILGFVSEGYIIILSILYMALIMVPVGMFHELLHGLTYKVLGGRVKIGFRGIYAYCQETSGIQLTRTQFLVVLLMPVTIISVISMILPYKWGLIVFILNLLGSSGDIFMALWLCRVKSAAKIVDKSYGFDVKL